MTIIFTLPRSIPGNSLAVLLSQIMQHLSVNPELVKVVEKKFLEEFEWDKPIHL